MEHAGLEYADDVRRGDRGNVVNALLQQRSKVGTLQHAPLAHKDDRATATARGHFASVCGHGLWVVGVPRTDRDGEGCPLLIASQTNDDLPRALLSMASVATSRAGILLAFAVPAGDSREP